MKRIHQTILPLLIILLPACSGSIDGELGDVPASDPSLGFFDPSAPSTGSSADPSTPPVDPDGIAQPPADVPAAGDSPASDPAAGDTPASDPTAGDTPASDPTAGDTPPADDGSGSGGDSPQPSPDPCAQPDAPGCHCENGVKDGDESDVDCGGSCAKCKQLALCNGPADCATNACEPPSATGAGCPSDPYTAMNVRQISASGDTIKIFCHYEDGASQVGIIKLHGFTASGACNDYEDVRAMTGAGGTLLLECSNTAGAYLKSSLSLDGASANGGCAGSADLHNVWTANGKLMLRCTYNDEHDKKVVETITFTGPKRCQ